MSEKKIDLTYSPDLQKHAKGTGPIRTQKPEYVDFLPPCNNACPAGENIQAWLALAMENKFEEAWRELVKNNPMPAIHGRVCYHPCEDACNRSSIDGAVSIHAVERFLGDSAIEKNWQFKNDSTPTNTRVLIIGAGPSGLSAAYHLKKKGHDVVVMEAGPIAGGMMNFGIPAYRLPRNILRAEIKKIENLGIEFILNHKVNNVLEEKEKGNFDAVFIAIGAHISKKIDIPAREAGKIMDALTFLKNAEKEDAPRLGRKVAIYGGGNTAMDAARVAKRMGYEPLIIYRRDRDHMPAHDFEADEALSEGVKINWLRTIKEIDNTSFKVEIMRINEEGRPVGTGEYETLEADALIMALGQDTDTGFLTEVPGIEFDWGGTVKVGMDMMTGHDGIFAGGDMVPSDRTVTVAVGHGKKAANYIDGYLMGKPFYKAPKHPIVGVDRLQIWYKTQAPTRTQEELKVEDRTHSFDEVVAGLTEEEARYEAMRCYSCGNCFECDGCFGACPEGAVIKLGKGNRYEFDYEKCTGCAVCYEQCPCHAIDMVDESFTPEI